MDLHRLRLLRELRERGTIAAVADALSYTPSAVSQQLAVLERETGVRLLERSSRSVRLTDAALVLAEHADALLHRAELAAADLAAAADEVTGRARIAGFQSVLMHVAIPAVEQLARDAPRLRCELIEAEPETALPALARGDIDLVLADEWLPQPLAIPSGVVRHELGDEPIRVVLPRRHPLARREPERVPLAELADAAWVTSEPALAWEQMVRRTCVALGGFQPDIRHRSDDGNLALAIVARGLAVTLLPGLALLGRHGGVAIRGLREGTPRRGLLTATRATDARRPSTRALLDAVRAAAAAVPDLG